MCCVRSRAGAHGSQAQRPVHAVGQHGVAAFENSVNTEVSNDTASGGASSRVSMAAYSDEEVRRRRVPRDGKVMWPSEPTA